jgi:prevent-host-death family protein
MQAAQAKREFRALLDAAERGESTIVVRHGKPVAVVHPIAPASPDAVPGSRLESPTTATTVVHTSRGGETGIRRPTRPGGLLAAVAIMQGWDSMQEDVEAIIRAGAGVSTRSLPDETFEKP